LESARYRQPQLRWSQLRSSLAARADCGWARSAWQAAMDNERELPCANMAFRAAVHSDRGGFQRIPQIARIAAKRCPPAQAWPEQTRTRTHNCTAREGDTHAEEPIASGSHVAYGNLGLSAP